MFSSPFGTKVQKKLREETRFVFVSDMFVNEYVGGAELTSQSLIDSCPLEIETLKSSEVTVDLLEQGHKKYWIFGNFAGLNKELIPTIVANMEYSVLEYDYKYCRYRSTEKHKVAEQEECNCHQEMHGKMVSAFYQGAKSLWWMSEGQMDHYTKLFPFLLEKDNTVLSSVFDDKFFLNIKDLREKYKEKERKGWLVLGSNSWIKGTDAAKAWCEDNNKEYEVLHGLSHVQVLEKMAQAEGFVLAASTAMDVDLSKLTEDGMSCARRS